MGWFQKVVGGAMKVKNEAMEEVSKISRQDDVISLLAVMALVGGADGVVTKEEETMMVDFVRMGEVFKGFDREFLANRMATNLKKCTNPILRDDLETDIMGIADEPDTCIKVMKAGIAIAGSDGSIGDEEKEVLTGVCKMLKLNPADFPKLKA
jgi:tellurium resistance protein TerD